MEKIFKINDIDYDCEFTLSNPDNQSVTYTKSAVKGMTLIDNVFDPFIGGTISVANPYDFFENDYFLRGDGRDEFLIKFKPVESTSWKNARFEHTFVIVDDLDTVNPMVRSENIKTFRLVSKRSIPFTDRIPYNKTYSGKIGDILKDIFIELLGMDSVDEENWESGDFEIFYIPPATFRYIDLIHYFMKLYYAKYDDIYVKGFINYDNISKKYTLKLLSKIFKDHKKYEMEAFGVGDLTTEIGFENKNNPPSGPQVGEYIGQLRNMSYSTPLYGWTNDFFVNSLVIGYDKIMGQQKISKLDFDLVKKRWSKIFVDPFVAKGGKVKPFAITNNSTSKKFKRYKFPYPVEVGVKIVESEIHNALTFYNLQIAFNNIGNTARSSGGFIDIFTPRKNGPPLKSDEKLLGRWYVTEVRHIFFGDNYTNQIFATKTYIGPSSKVNEEVD